MQIIRAIKEYEYGVKVGDILQGLGICNATFKNCRSKVAGIEENKASRLRELATENNKLKRMLAYKASNNRCCEGVCYIKSGKFRSRERS